jgi:hypothetical protein
VSPLVAQKLARLKTIVAERTAWEKSLTQVNRMHQWVLDVEHILDGSWAKPGERLSNAKVGRRFDRWRKTLAQRLTDGTLSPFEQECLEQFLQVLSHLRPSLIQCYDRESFPRTNTEMERRIRGLKTRYRRSSGRKNWNSYLLRYRRCVAYYDWWEQHADRRQQLVQPVSRLDRARWHQMRREAKSAQSEQLTRFRFRHKRETYLASLEVRWAAATTTHPLP